MKGYYYSPATATSPAAAVAAASSKRRWRGLAVAVPALVLCSLLVPLAFLPGLHSHHRSLPPGYGSEDRLISTEELGFGAHKHLDGGGGREQKLLEGEDSRVDDLMRKFGPAIAKDASQKISSGANGFLGKKASASKKLNELSKSKHMAASSFIELKNSSIKFKGPRMQKVGGQFLSWSLRDNITEGKENHVQVVARNENRKSCQLEFGSYCLWSIEHKEVMKDAIVKRLKDQLFVARAHYPSVAKLKQQEKLTCEMKQNIQEHERMLSETISDADLPPFVGEKIEKMDHTIAKAKSSVVGCQNVERKFRQILDLTEDEAHFHMRQSAFLYHLGVQTMPRSHHCLTMRLTLEYFKSSSIHLDQLNAQKLESPSFQHYVIFSRNILAASTTVNSTATNSKKSGNIVFHVLTDGQNFYAMKHWFARNSYMEATVHVLNIQDHLPHSQNFGSQQLSPSEEFRVTVRNSSQPIPMQMRTEYISVFGHSHFLLPDIFPSLNRIMVLDDDLVIQQDLSSLWNLDLGGKVIGAAQFCEVRLGHLKAYMGGYNFNANSCSWMSGLNVVDLEKWRDHNITAVYHGLLQKLPKGSEASLRETALPISLVAFQDLIYPLEDFWVQSGLGYDYGVTPGALEKAATLHYNGVMKPWLDLGIHNYKHYWKKYITRGERFMTECNINS